MLQEISPLLPTMVAEKVSISQQVLVSQSSLSPSRKSTQYLAALIGNFTLYKLPSQIFPFLRYNENAFLYLPMPLYCNIVRMFTVIPTVLHASRL